MKLEDKMEEFESNGGDVDSFECVNSFITKYSELKRVGVNKPINNL